MFRRVHTHAVKYGSEAHLIKKKKRARFSNLVLSQTGQFHKYWNFILVAFLLYTSLTVPY